MSLAENWVFPCWGKKELKGPQLAGCMNIRKPKVDFWFWKFLLQRIKPFILLLKTKLRLHTLGRVNSWCHFPLQAHCYGGETWATGESGQVGQAGRLWDVLALAGFMAQGRLVSLCACSDSRVWFLATPARLLCPWDFPGKNTGVGSHFLLQRIFLTQGWKLSPTLVGRFFTAESPGEPMVSLHRSKVYAYDWWGCSLDYSVVFWVTFIAYLQTWLALLTSESPQRDPALKTSLEVKTLCFYS